MKGSPIDTELFSRTESQSLSQRNCWLRESVKQSSAACILREERERETKKFVEWKLARVFDNNSELPVNRIKKKKKKNRRTEGGKLKRQRCAVQVKFLTPPRIEGYSRTICKKKTRCTGCGTPAAIYPYPRWKQTLVVTLTGVCGGEYGISVNRAVQVDAPHRLL